MDYISWEKMHETGLPLIDAQHKKLFSIINKYHNSEIDTDEIFKELITYTDFHFKTEEYYFDKFNYIFSAEHKKAHKYYKDTVIDLSKQYLANKNDPMFNTRVEEFVKEWISDHILLSDMLYVPCFIEHGLEYRVPILSRIKT